jgi:hypothetical protein
VLVWECDVLVGCWQDVEQNIEKKGKSENDLSYPTECKTSIEKARQT